MKNVLPLTPVDDDVVVNTVQYDRPVSENERDLVAVAYELGVLACCLERRPVRITGPYYGMQ